MKRSEMVTLLKQTLGACGGWDEQCEYMLQVIEAAGMLPPERPEESYKVNKQGRLVDVSNSWEPEDKNSKQNKLKPTPLTDEELADVIANDEDLQNET